MSGSSKRLSEADARGIDSGDVPNRAQRVKFAVFSLILALVGIACLEGFIRVSGLDDVALKTPTSPFLLVPFQKMTRNDDLLFYSLRPNAQVLYNKVTITTNSLGLRCAEVSDKEENEFRILSIGESSAFGAGVEDDETYASVLERELAQADGAHRYRVINAGVPAYSSFQGRRYFEERGVKLDPDMLLVYHELADFLPTTNREFLISEENGLPLTDKELAESKSHTVNRWLLESFAIFRFISHSIVRNEIKELQSEEVTQGAEHVTIPEFMHDISTPEGMRALKLPQRVSLEEREENFTRLMTLCAENGIQLVVIHPSYAESERHECDLTAFCERNHIPIFDAYDSLHPAEGPEGGYYWDLWHPNAIGHKNLGEDLFQFLCKNKLVPATCD